MKSISSDPVNVVLDSSLANTGASLKTLEGGKTQRKGEMKEEEREG